METKFTKLFDPAYIGEMKVRNRLVKAATHTGLADQNGYITERQIRFYRDLAIGNVGLIIVGFTYIDNKASKSLDSQISVNSDEYIPGLSRLAATIHENGAKAALQIAHAGNQVFLTTLPVKAPSRVPWERMYARGAPPPEELTFEEIGETVEAFGDAALRATKAGFDMVEVHGAHGYLITGFLSPITNRRADWYGGSLANRMRFLLEVVQNIRSKIGNGYPLGVRLSGSEYREGGIEINETIEVAKALEKSGVDVLHMSGGIHATESFEVASMYRPFALHVHLAKAIKDVVHIPIIASGSITSPQLAEHILRKGHADFISLARPLFADSFFAKKAEEGRAEDIVPCIRCNECKARYVISGQRSCTVNVSFGSEIELDIKPVAKGRNIAVIGGGPGGMEAARVAALKGHQVTLYESSNRLGGRLSKASVFLPDIANLINYLSTQLKKLGVKVILGSEATVQTLQGQSFESVILATGAMALLPDIRGIDKQSVMTVEDVLEGKRLGQNVVIVGGGFIGCETALFLTMAGKLYGLLQYRRMLPQGWVQWITRLLLGKVKLPSLLRKKIRIIEASAEVASGIEDGDKEGILEHFSEYGVEINLGLRLEEVIKGGVIAVDRHGKRYNFKADSIVFTNFAARNDLLDGLKKANLKVHAVGDCVEPRRIYDAIHAGHLAALNLK